MSTLDFNDDMVAVSDIAERIEELREARDEYNEKMDNEDAWLEIEDGEPEELAALEALMDELRGYGGDEQWLGDWYPATLIADSHFTEYAKGMLEDCGTIPADLPSWVAIDWEETASAVQQDYSSVDFDGNSFWYR